MACFPWTRSLTAAKKSSHSKFKSFVEKTWLLFFKGESCFSLPPPPSAPTYLPTCRLCKVVNALSEWAEVEVVRGGQRHFLSFERGKTQGGLVSEEAGADALGGTVVRFMPDPQVTYVKYNENKA